MIPHGLATGAAAVLIADQDDPVAAQLAASLRARGLIVYPTRRGDDAVRIADSVPLALAVVDVALADMSGYQLATHLRATRPKLLVMMTTADARPELEVEARRVGIIHYAHKPLDPGRVTAVLAAALRAGGPPASVLLSQDGRPALSRGVCAAPAPTEPPWRGAPGPR